MDAETKRAWRKLQKEVRENAPIVARGLASSGKRIPRKLYSSVVRGCKSLSNGVKEWDVSFDGGKTLLSRLARVRLRSPIYKV